MAIPASITGRNALVFLAVVAGGAALYWMRDILTPLAMAGFLAVRIDSFPPGLGVGVAGGAALYWMRDILTPLAMAVFLAVMIDSFARVLVMRLPRFPRSLALPTAIVLSIAMFGASVWVVTSNGAGFVSQIRDYAPRL